MSKLDAALYWASRGFPVFPLQENGKSPAYDGSWIDLSTTDPSTIRGYWTDPVLGTERDFNIGVNCTDRVVVDIDVKDGKDGLNQYRALGGTYDTLVVATPSGGYHCYYEGPDSSNVPIAKDVDIRSHNGFVVAPGSTIDGVPYQVVNDIEPIWVPIEVDQLLKPPYSRRDGGASQGHDTPSSIEAGRNFLIHAETAVQGARGDDVTFQTAARLCREFALSIDAAYELMVEHWNDRCSPPWDLYELRQKVENAAEYGTADVGRLDPQMVFADVNIAAPDTVFQQTGSVFGNALIPTVIPPRPWMLDRILMLNEITMILAPGSAGKSSLSLALAAHMAVGKDFAGHTCRTKCKSIIYNGEDDVTEQSRRLLAVCQSYMLDYEDVKNNIMLLSSDTLDLKIVGVAGRTPVPNEAMVQQLVALAGQPDVGVIIYDPMVDVHDVDEGDNPQMNSVMKVLRRIGREANVATMVLHHTTKAGNTRQEDRVGNMDIARGAGGIVYKSRIALTLLNASAKDAEDYGMQDGERGDWVRLDDAKMNLTKTSEHATWFKKEGVRIISGDVVGVLKHSDLKKDTNQLRIRIAELLADTMELTFTGQLTLKQAVAIVKSHEPLWANKTDVEVRRGLEGFFSTMVEVGGRTLYLRRDGEGMKSTTVLVMA